MPEPAALPLPGGQAGATVRLRPLLTGELLAPPGLLARRGRLTARLRAVGLGTPKSDWLWIPAPAFLVEHPGAGAVLIDTGLHPQAQADPRRHMGWLSAWLYDFRIAAEQSLHAQLRAAGVEPERLAWIVMTHLHADHASGLPALPGARVIVDQGEWAFARGRASVREGYERAHLDSRASWFVVDHEGPAARPLGPFDRTLDLFGDGSVQLLSTPGHTAGHQSVLVRTGAREVLLAGDAAYTERTLTEGVMPGIAHDEQAFRRSLEQIQRYIAQTPDALAIPGHDPDAWARLEDLYE